MSEIVERLKKNEKPFGLLSVTEQNCLEILPIKYILELTEYAEWRTRDFGYLFGHLTYRISPDYQEEPGIVKCEVEPLKCLDGKLGYGRENYTFELTDALNDPDFIGFEYASGGTSSASRLTEFDKDRMRKGVPADRPKYVLFKRSK